jgi:hypothetical protein
MAFLSAIYCSPHNGYICHKQYEILFTGGNLPLFDLINHEKVNSNANVFN